MESKITISDAGAAGDRTEQVVLCEPVLKDTLLLSVRRSEESIQPEAAWDTLCVGERQHARFGNKALKLNHARQPCTRIDTSRSDRIDVVSTTDIAADTPLSFNYNTTEWSMAEPFMDWRSGETVGGFSAAGQEEQQWLLQSGLVASHIRARADRADRADKGAP